MLRGSFVNLSFRIAYVLHGGRFTSDGKFDPQGELRASDDVLQLADPSNPNLPHPLLLKVTSLSKLNFKAAPQTHAQKFVRSAEGKEVHKVLSAEDDAFIRASFKATDRPVPADLKLDVRLAKQIVIRDELFRVNEDIRVLQDEGPVPYIGRIVEIGSFSHGGTDIPFCFVRWLRRHGREEKVGKRQVLLEDRDEPISIVWPESVLGRAAAFHNCKFSGERKCQQVEIRLCRPHNLVACATCPPNSGDLHKIFQCCRANREYLLDPHYGIDEV